jgi:hypothetical protein
VSARRVRDVCIEVVLMLSESAPGVGGRPPVRRLVSR